MAIRERSKRKVKVTMDKDWVYEFDGFSLISSSDTTYNRTRPTSSICESSASDPDYKAKRKRLRANSEVAPVRTVPGLRSVVRSCSELGPDVRRQQDCDGAELEGQSSPVNVDERSELFQKDGGLYGRRERMMLREWLRCEVERGRITGLTWIDKQEAIVRIPWVHGSKSGWSTDNCKLFESWAQHTGRYNVGKPDPKRWKANFRCALNSLNDVVEVPAHSCKRGVDAFKAYRFLPEQPRKNSTRRLSIPQRLLGHEKHSSVHLMASESSDNLLMLEAIDTIQESTILEDIPRRTVVSSADCSKYKHRKFQRVVETIEHSDQPVNHQALDHPYVKISETNSEKISTTNLDKIPVMCLEFTDDDDDDDCDNGAGEMMSIDCDTVEQSAQLQITTDVHIGQENIEETFYDDYKPTCSVSYPMSNEKLYYTDQTLTEYMSAQADLKTLENFVFAEEIDQLYQRKLI